MDIDPRSIEMCSPHDADPPLPDVRCLVSGQTVYFELGEVTDESFARAAGNAKKNRDAVFGEALGQRQPLTRLF